MLSWDQVLARCAQSQVILLRLLCLYLDDRHENNVCRKVLYLIAHDIHLVQHAMVVYELLKRARHGYLQTPITITPLNAGAG